MIKSLLRDLAASDSRWHIALMRYFNPLVAHRSGLIGEDPRGVPNNLLLYISQVAIGKLKVLNIYGIDYPTPDGKGVRDYINVQDLIWGHLKAVDVVSQQAGVAVEFRDWP